MKRFLKYAETTIEVPIRWRGQGGFPADAQRGVLSYTVTATDCVGRMVSFSPFINQVSQITIVEH